MSARVSGRRPRGLALALGGCIAALAAGAPARAQPGLGIPFPGQDRPEVPDFEPSQRPRGSLLPPVEVPPAEPQPLLGAEERVYVREIRVRGNTVLPEQEISELAAEYVGRELGFEDLASLRDRLTLAYVERGYVTSGARLPDQRIEDGVLEVVLVEGRLDEVEIQTDGRFRERTLRDRVAPDPRAVVNVERLERRLQVLQRDPRIRRIEAALLPGDGPGRSRLALRVSERRPFQVQLAANNYQPASVGEANGRLRLGFDNLFGVGDSLAARYRGGAGLQEGEGRFEIPLTRFDTRLAAYGSFTTSRVIDSPLSDLDIESRSYTVGLRLSQPLYRSLRHAVELYLAAEHRFSQTELLGMGFGFAPGVSENGVSRLTLLRVGTQWSYGSRSQALAARSQLTFGLPAGATLNPGGIPDGEFVAWLGQVQWARRLPWLESMLVSRADVQISDSGLLPLEQFAIGGYASVRGYRENTLVRDNGVIGSVELRVPLYLGSREQPILEIGPFVDAGHSWNSGRPAMGPRTLASVGLSTRVNLLERVRFQLDWGYPLIDVPLPGSGGLQGAGVHMGVRVDF